LFILIINIYEIDLYFPPTTKICYPKDITWVEDKDWANEAVLVYFINDDGGMGYIQIVYSSMSYVFKNCYILIHLIYKS